jgi:hypothetical protein
MARPGAETGLGGANGPGMALTLNPAAFVPQGRPGRVLDLENRPAWWCGPTLGPSEPF